MPRRHSATVLPFRASRRQAPGSRTGDRPLIGTVAGGGDAGRDNVVPLRRDVIVPSELTQRRMRRGPVTLLPPPGGEEA